MIEQIENIGKEIEKRDGLIKRLKRVVKILRSNIFKLKYQLREANKKIGKLKKKKYHLYREEKKIKSITTPHRRTFKIRSDKKPKYRKNNKLTY